MHKGVLKSYFMRFSIWVEPKLEVFVRALSIINALLSLSVVASLVYALGFRVKFDEAVNLRFFDIAFFAFYIEHCIFFINYLFQKKLPQNWIYSGLFFLLMTFIMVMWWMPEQTIAESVFLRIACHSYTLMAVVGIQAVIKFSTLLTSSLSNRLSPNWIFVGSFVLLIILGTGLLLLPRATYSGITPLQSLFTTVSAVCVTGLTVVDVPSTFTLTGQIFILVLVQLGGIGIMTFTSFFGLMFAGRHSSQNKLLIKDLIDPDKGVSQIFSTLRNILFITFLIEALGAWAIYHSIDDYSWYGAYVAVFHSVSAFCNAGFSVITDGLAHSTAYSNYALLNTISWLIILGGLGFPILFNIWRWLKIKIAALVRKVFGRRQSFVSTPRIITSNAVIVLIVTAVLLGSGTVIFFITEYENVLQRHPTLWGKLCTAFFLSATPRTAGFNAFDMASLMPVTVTYMILYMWVGGSPMSTAGGVKTTTLGIAILNVWHTLRGRDHIEIRHRALSQHTVNRSFIIIFVSLVVIAIGVCLMSAFEPHLPLQSIIFEVVSAFSTVGLSLNITPTLTIYSQILLICLMFIGRMGLLTLLACFIPVSNQKFYNYPTEHIPIN